MRVLVSAASRYGSTAEIAERIGAVLRQLLGVRDPHVEVDVRPPDRVGAVDGYDAVVLGSAVYLGRWLEPARELCTAHAQELAARPVWLFSSGPVGVPPKPDQDPVDLPAALEATKAREHRVFAGRLDRSRLGLADKAIVIALRAPEGDFRDWEAVEAWATGIAGALRKQAAARV